MQVMADPPLPAPFTWRDGHVAVDLDGGRALFSSRRGGVSNGAFASLNLGRLTDDTDVHVDENRARLATAIGIPRERILYGRQVHAARVRRATEPPGPERPHTEEDGQATALADAAALVFVADCLPVVLAADGAVAALHGGWRGMAAGVLEEGVRAMRDLGAHGEISAAMGPGAGGCCYEVGEEVHTAFGGHDARVGRRNLDLKKVAREKLASAGVAEIHDCGLCTMCSDRTLFFSHRRDGGVTGRQAGVVWRA